MTSINRADVNNLLTQMREMKAQAQSGREIQPGSHIERTVANGRIDGTKPTEFTDMFKSAINSVNEVQQQSKVLTRAYQEGDSSVTLTQVMVASEKAGVSFQALTQVRNKLIDAYKDVMNMPI
jgi:flagellar hook-basal body complex protein FliE